MDWRAILAYGLAPAALMAGGCGTVQNLQQAVPPKCVPEMPPDAPMKRVYGGVRSDYAVLTSRNGDEKAAEDSQSSVFALFDLPLSFIGDTITLPYVLAYELGFLGEALMYYPPPDDESCRKLQSSLEALEFKADGNSDTTRAPK